MTFNPVPVYMKDHCFVRCHNIQISDFSIAVVRIQDTFAETNPTTIDITADRDDTKQSNDLIDNTKIDTMWSNYFINAVMLLMHD